jgi:hypothetical protein
VYNLKHEVSATNALDSTKPEIQSSVSSQDTLANTSSSENLLSGSGMVSSDTTTISSHSEGEPLAASGLHEENTFEV